MTIRHMCVRETNENDEMETDVINNLLFYLFINGCKQQEFVQIFNFSH